MSQSQGVLDDLHHLQAAARLALRGHGGAEPNPMVGCVIVAPSGKVVGDGYHRLCGEAHAEIVALKRAGAKAAGATLYSTLEPCTHIGRTGPCSDAIIKSGVARVVVARRDPNPVAAGGLERLKSAGLKVEVNDRCEAAVMVSDPFAHQVRSGLPWVIAKWAQTIDGRIATRPPHNESQWISNESSRRMGHRERGRVDAILTGIGTVLKDDPLLTPRGVRIRRPRPPLRLVIDPQLQIPLGARLVTSTSAAPTIVASTEDSLKARADHALKLRERGVEIMPLVGGIAECLPLASLLRQLVAQHDVTNVLVEAGPGLLRCLFTQNLINEAWVFIAPLLLGDEQAKSVITGMTAANLADAMRLKLQHVRQRQSDVILHYRLGRS